jgi:DedD protein
MPLPSSENDLKRRARRRLIGAVALTLVAVIVLPLLLEDEPPPASSLAVHMAVAPKPAPEPVPQSSQVPEPDVTAEPVQAASDQPSEPQPEPAKPAPPPDPKPPARPEPVKAEPVKAKPPKPVATLDAQTKPAAAHEVFVVQLAALSDGDKAQALKGRVAQLGLPVYTDAIGSLTRVRVGPFNSRTAAVAAAVKLAENGMSGQVLTK